MIVTGYESRRHASSFSFSDPSTALDSVGRAHTFVPFVRSFSGSGIPHFPTAEQPKRPTRLSVSSPLPTHNLTLRCFLSSSCLCLNLFPHLGRSVTSFSLRGDIRDFYFVFLWCDLYLLALAYRTLASLPTTSSARTITSPVPPSRSKPPPLPTSPSRSTEPVTQSRPSSPATSRASTLTRATA